MTKTYDLLTDLDRELIPMLLTERLVEILRGIELRSRSYLDLYREMIDALRAGVSRHAGWNSTPGYVVPAG